MDQTTETKTQAETFAEAAAVSAANELEAKRAARPPRIFTEMLPCKLSPEELLDVLEQIGSADADVTVLEEERKAANDGFKARIALAGVRHLLVEAADRASANSGAPQGFGDVLHPAHTDAGQVHLHQRFFDGRLTPPIAFNNRRLKGHLLELRHLQLHFPGGGMQRAFIVARAVAAPLLGPFVPGRLTEALGFGLFLFER